MKKNNFNESHYVVEYRLRKNNSLSPYFQEPFKFKTLKSALLHLRDQKELYPFFTFRICLMELKQVI